MKKITAIIPTFNEAYNIERALRSVTFADEVIVIDSFSTDETVELVKKHEDVILLQREFDDFSTQKNYAISKASHDWIFLLDADEEVTPALKEEVLTTIASKPKEVAFYIYRTYFFKQTKLNFSGWQNDKVIRLFKRDANEYLGKVHEEISAKGEIGFLKAKLNHYSYRNYSHYTNKLKHYSKLQGVELFEKNKIITFYHLLFKPLFRFLIQFFVKLGILDGWRGLVISYVHSQGVFLRYVELLKLKYQLPKSNIDKSRYRVLNLFEEFPKDLSIIIVNYKNWDNLDRCLTSLKSIQQNRFSFEVIIVDNFSNDEKLEVFSSNFKEFTFIQNTGNNGFANASNVGAELSNAEYLLFLNSDTVINEEAIFNMFAQVKEHKNYGIVSCAQLNSKGENETEIRFFPSLFNFFSRTRTISEKSKKEYKRVNEIKDTTIISDWLSGSLILISKDWFTKINRWNEDYWMYYEDVDLSKRISNKEGKIVLLNDTSIIQNQDKVSQKNIINTSLSKTEMLISRHVYVANHFKGMSNSLAQFTITFLTLSTKIILGILGVILYFIPKLRVQWHILINLIQYYFSVAKNRTWLSPRSMNFKK